MMHRKIIPITNFLFLALLLTSSCVTSTPAPFNALAPAINTVLLWNGVSDTLVNLESRTDSVAGLSTRDSINCKGSGLCSGPLISPAQCQSAYNLIMPGNTYNAGGSASGACSGHCGVFVQSYDGTGGCSVLGSQLQSSFNTIRANGCKVCGSDEFRNGCEVTINYVGSC